MNTFADSNSQSITRLAYEQFMRHGNSRFNIRESVKKSWQRCKDQQVSPNKEGAHEIVEGDTFKNLLWQNKLLIEAATPILQKNEHRINLSNCMSILTDARGYILRTGGSCHVIRAAEAIALQEGACWHEKHCGTNGIGTTLSANAPIQIYADEHYCENIKQWSCSGAVIHYPSNHCILGVLDISSSFKYHSKNHLIEVMTLAKRIEWNIYEIEAKLRCHLEQAFLKKLDKNPHNHYAMLNRFGHIVQTTPDFCCQFVNLENNNLNLNDIFRRRSCESLYDYQRRICANDEFYSVQEMQKINYQGDCTGFIIEIFPQVSKKSRTRPPHSAFAEIIGSNGALHQICHQAQRFAHSWSPILISGETGTGKELFARALHAISPAKDGPFIALNCGAFSRELFNSELFGYKDGAFTGARKGGMMGKIEAADHGTLFLDEIGEMPIELQPQLLRVLGTGEFYRLGENQVRTCKFRLIAATNRNLQDEVIHKRFRSDLFYRLSVCHLPLPPLRARDNDIDLLIEHFLNILSQQHNKKFTLAAALKKSFKLHHWHGNVRELLNVLEYMALLSDGDELNENILPHYLQDEFNGDNHHQQKLSKLANNEENCIRKSIAEHHGNLSGVAKDLGIVKSTLYTKIKKYYLQDFIGEMRRAKKNKKI